MIIDVDTNAVHDEFLNNNRNVRTLLMYGGASSGKSWAISQDLIITRFLQEPGAGILSLRKTNPAVKKSCYKLLKHWLNLYNLNDIYKENKADQIIYNKYNGAFVYYMGLDDPEKIKSIEGINYIWIEEATEFDYLSYLQLQLRCRAKNDYGINQVILSFNPVDPNRNKWIKDLTEKPDENMQVKVFLYKDNAFLADEEIRVIESLADADPEYDKIYRLGQWAIPSHIIYQNWQTVKNIQWNKLDRIGYGLDFGYNNPTSLIKCGFYDKIHVFIKEIIYETKLTNSDLIKILKKEIGDKEHPIIADSAEPDRIEEIYNEGFNIIPAIKGPGSVGVGIDRCQRKAIYIDYESNNVIEEIRGYKWAVDKNNEILDKPVQFRDHAMDAMRYYIGYEEEVEMMFDEIGTIEGF